MFSYDIVIIFSCKVGVLNLDSRRKVMVDLWISSLTSKMAHNNGSHTQTFAAITLIENYAFSCIGLPAQNMEHKLLLAHRPAPKRRIMRSSELRR